MDWLPSNMESSLYTGYCDIMVAKEKQWLLRQYLKNAMLLG